MSSFSSRRIGPVERIATFVYLTFATAMALAGFAVALFTAGLCLVWLVEASIR